MPDIYQFIKYNAGTSTESLRKKGDPRVVICFDLEDSIVNWIDESKNTILKKKTRETLKRILYEYNAEAPETKIGIRINSFQSGLQALDLECIPSDSKIHTILIPKVENKNHIDHVADSLTSKNIIFGELIPIIESRKGLENIEDIISSKYKVSKVGFGHCDYNLSIHAFPFFHQNSIEYWKWVYRIINILRPHKIKFINSAYLHLNDSVFFQSMLSHLQFIYADNFGQFTLSHQQTALCKTFTKQTVSLEAIAKHRLELSTSKIMLTSQKAAFENENTGQGFTITSGERILISPQEYYSAKQHLGIWKKNNVDFTFVGGCFPVQGNILFEDIFHQTLKNRVEHDFNVNFNVNIIRYERFNDCLEKIITFSKDHRTDYLVFHVRPEPFLRLIKLYYKYLNYENKLCRSLNIPYLSILNPEKYDLLMLSRRYNYSIVNNHIKLHKTLVNLNYLSGYLLGNYNYALNKYLTLVNNVINYCAIQHINIIILGPAIRSETAFEKTVSEKLEKFMSRYFQNKKTNYISGIEKQNKDVKLYFSENGIHATGLYHELIANRLYANIENDIKLKKN